MFNSAKFKTEFIKSGLPQAEIDRRLGKSATYTNKYVNGKASPSPDTLCAFLLAFGWTNDQLQAARLTDWYSVN